MSNSGPSDSSNDPPIWHIIIAVIGSKGDVFPYFQLAKALSSHGHRITILTNAVFRSHVVAMGFEFAELGTVQEFEDALDNRELFTRKGQRLVFKILA